jgi:serine/threonine protein kinase
VMEFLRGHTLRDEIDRNGAFELSRAVGVALEVASALIEVHARGIVHRDINPRNIMIADYAIKLIDFGIAKFPQPPGAPPFTQHSALAGTVAYASPEQCASHPVDHRSDIYSLGVVLYEMATGRRPFNGRTPTEVALKQIQSEPTPPRLINPAISVAAEKTILRALAKNPADRQQSAEELSEELRKSSNQILIPLAVTNAEAEDQYESGNGIAPSVDPVENEETAESDLRLVRRRRRRFVVGAAATLIAVITAAVLFGWPSASSRGKAVDLSANVVTAASPSPEATPAVGSDADSLELAAGASSQNNNAAGASTPSAQAAADTTRQPQAANSTSPSNKAVAGPPTPSPAPAPIPPGARPQMPPAPSPEIAANRAPQLDSEPDPSQGPDKEHNGGAHQRENDPANGDSNHRQSDDMNRDSDRDDGYAPNRRRDNDSYNRRRLPDPPNRDEVDREDRDNDHDDSSRIGPKLYQWSGRVDYQREITIELPGVPGTVEIPRAFRDRVGVIEPPSVNNRWSCVVLRVFGRGGVSIIVRWWPAARKAVRLTAWK